MRVLLDTHTFLWFIWADAQLSQTARNSIEDMQNQKYLSIASLWEIVIKVRLGKLNLLESLPDFFSHYVDDYGFIVLPVERNHLLTLATLPLQHRDPFDRILIAQSIQEGMPLLSADHIMDSYPVSRIW